MKIKNVNRAYEGKCFKYVKPMCRLDEGKHESLSSARINELCKENSGTVSLTSHVLNYQLLTKWCVELNLFLRQVIIVPILKIKIILISILLVSKIALLTF